MDARNTSTDTLKPPPRGGGFTLIELLVTVAVIAVLIGILLPALSATRQAAQNVQCQSNLRSLAQAANAYAASGEGHFSSGAWQNSTNELSYGPMESFIESAGPSPPPASGWVHDMISGESAIPGQILCPGSEARFTEVLKQSKMRAGWKRYSPEQVDRVIDAGFNTNYAQSWYMAATATKDPKKVGAAKTRGTVIGPLKITDIRATTPSRVPLFGDARTDNLQNSELVLYSGQRAPGAESITDGPDKQGVTGRLGKRSGRQDYTELGPAHGSGTSKRVAGGGAAQDIGHSKGWGNIVFADASADTFFDTSSDGTFGSTGPGAERDGWTVWKENAELDGRVFGGDLLGRGIKF